MCQQILMLCVWSSQKAELFADLQDYKEREVQLVN